MMENVQTSRCDVEDGELSQSSDEVYNPLQRPTTLLSVTDSNTVKTTTTTIFSSCSPCHQMQHDLDGENDDTQSSSLSSGESTDDCIKGGNMTQQSNSGKKRQQRKRVRRTVMVRVPTDKQEESLEKRTRFKRYSVWTAALQEEALTENMRVIGVTSDDRNVESYDFRRRINGSDNCLKRRLSNSADDLSDSEMVVAKRGRPSSRDEEVQFRQGVKSRLGHRSQETSGICGSPATSGDSNNSYEPRHILDIKEVEGRDPLDVAREMATNLCEEKNELWLRIVDILGLELPMELFKETRRIEADGGMMVLNGKRRRTPGGVFLFLLKHSERLTPDQQKSIFVKERQKDCKWRKEIKSKSRDRKVEELKKRLSEKEKELTALNTRKDLVMLGSELNLEQQTGNLSNPPPSPVGNEQSPDYKPHAINHVENDGTEPSTSASAIASTLTTSSVAVTSPFKQAELVSYEDDFLDVNCGEMDFF